MYVDDIILMVSSYGYMVLDLWDRVLKFGMFFYIRVGQSFQQVGVIDMLEDSLELIEIDLFDFSGGRVGKDQRFFQKGVFIVVVS